MAVVARIFLRYVAGVLLAKGIITADTQGLFSDPELAGLVEMAIGIGVGFLVEGWYLLARRLGFKT